MTNIIVQPNTAFTCNARLFTISCFDFLSLLKESMLTELLVALGNQPHRKETLKTRSSRHMHPVATIFFSAVTPRDQVQSSNLSLFAIDRGIRFVLLNHVCFTNCNKLFEMYFWLLSDTSCTRWLQVQPRLYGHRTRKPTGDRNTGQTKNLKNTFGGMSKQVNIALSVSASQQNTLLLLNIQDTNFRGCLLLNRYALSKKTRNPNRNPNIDLEQYSRA